MSVEKAFLFNTSEGGVFLMQSRSLSPVSGSEVSPLDSVPASSLSPSQYALKRPSEISLQSKNANNVRISAILAPSVSSSSSCWNDNSHVVNTLSEVSLSDLFNLRRYCDI